MAKYFSDKEFSCKCGCGLGLKSPYKIDPLLADICDCIRSAVNAPVIVNSGWRCQYNNAKAGGVVYKKICIPGTKKLDLSKYSKGMPGLKLDSHHTHGTAVDLSCPSLSVSQFYNLICQLFEKGVIKPKAIGKYSTFTHIDVDPSRTRFVYFNGGY